MKRLRIFGKLIVISLAIAASTFLLFIKKPSYFKKPNIIILSIDTLRADHLSCYGYFRETSPNIDAFSKDAVLFQNSISQAPLTAPAHMSIFTSLTPSVHQIASSNEITSSEAGINREKEIFKRVDQRIETLPLIMKKNGYLTIGLHGGGNVSAGFGFDRGFDIYREWGDPLELKDRIEDVRKVIIESKKKNAPLFIFLHHYVCHDPYLNSPDEFSLHFISEKVNGLPLRREDICSSKDIDESREYFWKRIDLSNSKHRDHVISLYDGGIYYSDYIFGKLIETLKKENFYSNSIVILLSDHGEEFYEHLDKLHWRLLIETLRVPLIIKFPRNIYGGKIIHAPVRTMDIMPTLLDFLGIKTHSFMQGVSFLPLIRRKGDYSPCIVSYSLSRVPKNKWTARFIKEGFVYSNQFSQGVEDRLFDMNNDPLEKNNLSAHKPEILGQMHLFTRIILEKDRVIREKIGCKNSVLIEKKEQLLKELKSLGYTQ